ncbi:MAG: hypothetical protein ACKO8I_12915 [Cyanobacteriota bacterium]
MARRNPTGDFLQFTVGGCLFGGGLFLFLNQVSVSSAWHSSGFRRSWGGFRGWDPMALMPFGTPGLGLLMVPLGLGVCLLFAGTYQRWARLLVWGSLAALVVGVLNSVRISFIPATLWQLTMQVVMIGSGGGLMFRSLGPYNDQGRDRGGPSQAGSASRDPSDPNAEEAATANLRWELDELKRRLDEQQG